MLVDLVDKLGWKWFGAESVKQIHPSIELRASVIVAHSRGVVLNDLNELTHDLGKEDDTSKHEDDTNNLFSP